MNAKTELQLTRAAIYRFLADCFYPPDEQFLSNIDNILAQIPCLNDEIDAELSSLKNIIKTASDFESVQLDSSRLFFGPFETKAPPYSSFYLNQSQQVINETTEWVLRKYQSWNIQISENRKEAPDHISIELEFMQFLILQNLADENQNSNVTKALESQNEFLNQHLTKWVPQFTKTIDEAAQTLFFKCVSRVLAAFINHETALFQHAEAAT